MPVEPQNVPPCVGQHVLAAHVIRVSFGIAVKAPAIDFDSDSFLTEPDIERNATRRVLRRPSVRVGQLIERHPGVVPDP